MPAETSDSCRFCRVLKRVLGPRRNSEGGDTPRRTSQNLPSHLRPEAVTWDWTPWARSRACMLVSLRRVGVSAPVALQEEAELMVISGQAKKPRRTHWVRSRGSTPASQHLLQPCSPRRHPTTGRARQRHLYDAGR